MQTSSTGLMELLQDKYAQVVIGLMVVSILVAIGVYLVGRIRQADEEPHSTSDVLSSFRDLRDDGELTDEEFKSIKSKLSAKLKEEAARPPAKEDKT